MAPEAQELNTENQRLGAEKQMDYVLNRATMPAWRGKGVVPSALSSLERKMAAARKLSVQQALLDLTIYQSSYMTDFQPYGNYGYIRMEPGEKEKLDRQLREKELYRPVVSPTPKLSAGYAAFEGTHLTARDLGRPCFLLPQAGPAQEAAPGEPEEEPLEEDACRVAGTCPCMYPFSYGLGVARARLDSPLYQVANLPCLLEPARQPAPHIGTGYFLMPGCLCTFHHKIKYPILSRWGPLLPFYQ